MKRLFKILIVATIAVLGIAASTQNLDNNKYFEIIKNIEIFTNVYKELNTHYVDDLDPGSLMRIGIDAMVESLDPYTNYISESDIEKYRFRTEGKYHGIGAISKVMGDYVTITELYKDQPADRAGLRVGDQITAVNNQDAKGKNSEELNNILQGFPGTEVVLTVKRPGEKNDVKIVLVRGEVDVPNVPYSGMVDNQVGYVKLSTFTRQAGRNIAEAIETLRKDNPSFKGLILDLRGNGGGLLTEAINLSNLFIPKGEIVVTTKGKVKDWDRAFKTLNKPLDEEMPLVVLINNKSASASEIVGGVIQDYDRGVLMGQRSYGKGLVQNTRDLGYNAKVKLTTAKYYIPSGRCIQSVEYENGEPVNIPDSRRTPFKTRNGRTVLDGGGVKPDVYIDKPQYATIVKNLIDQNIIFDYVTQFCLEHDSIASVESFHFEDFDGFVKYVEEVGFKYDTKSEQLLEQLKAVTGKESEMISDDIARMEQEIEESKSNAIYEQKAVVVDLIEKEIAGRYYYQRGNTQMNLRNDKEIDEAVKLLKDSDTYDRLLKGK